MKNNNWQHLVTRRLAVQVAIAWNHGFGELFNKIYLASINNTLVFFDGKKTDYFVDKEESKQFHKDLDKHLDNSEFVAGMIPEAKKFVEDKYQFIKEMIRDIDQLSDKELAELYSEFSKHHAEYYTRMWAVFRICERIVLKIEHMLRKTIKDEKRVKELTRIFSTPLEPNDVTKERMDLLRIALNKGICLKQHAEKYNHIPMYDFDHDPYTSEHFETELEAIQEPEKEIRKIEESFRERKEEFNRALEDIKPDQKLLNLILMLKEAVILRDYRDMIRQKLNLEISDFYDVIGQRIGLDVKDIALLTNEEIEKYLLNSRNFSTKEIENRKQSFLLHQSGTDIRIYSAKSAENKAEEIGLKKPIDDSLILTGITASGGSIIGTARIVHTNLDLEKVNEGDILVAGMTRQDFVSVMRKASAIITSEGGVTCHAAIIARELGLPCIVGAENATQVIKDGDRIHIDGEKGIIRKLS